MNKIVQSVEKKINIKKFIKKKTKKKKKKNNNNNNNNNKKIGNKEKE